MAFAPPPGPVILAPDDTPDHPLAPWFEHARGERRAARSGRTGGSRALITMVHDEPVFLPLWLRYYSRFFAPEDIFVLDNETTDGSTDRDGFVRIPVEHDTVDHRWMVRTIEDLQRELLGRYDMVLVTDVDEIVAPAPSLGTLGDYLESFNEAWVNCLGYELIHVRGEPPLELDRPILEQRGHWFFNDVYDKAALATAPLEWKPGFHGRADQHFRLDPDLRLIHLHRMDRDICRERHRSRAQRPWAAEDERRGWAAHNRIVEDEQFDHWFDGAAYVEGLPFRVEPIPETWRGLF